MKLNKTMMALVMAMGVSSFAQADQGHGKVTFTGSIIDAPCSISPDSVDQTIDMGQISNAALLNGGKSTPRDFTIDLENCVFTGDTAKNKVTVTFSGASTASGLLGITGSASGAGIALTHQGETDKIKLGTPTTAQTLQNGNNTLKFAAYVQGDAEKIVEGDFTAVTDFTLAYN